MKNKNMDLSYAFLARQYQVNSSNIEYLVALINLHGTDIVRVDKNNKYLAELKIEIINRVLIEGRSIRQAVLEYVLLIEGMLINSYKSSEYIIVEKRNEDLLL